MDKCLACRENSILSDFLFLEGMGWLTLIPVWWTLVCTLFSSSSFWIVLISIRNRMIFQGSSCYFLGSSFYFFRVLDSILSPCTTRRCCGKRPMFSNFVYEGGIQTSGTSNFPRIHFVFIHIALGTSDPCYWVFPTIWNDTDMFSVWAMYSALVWTLGCSLVGKSMDPSLPFSPYELHNVSSEQETKHFIERDETDKISTSMKNGETSCCIAKMVASCCFSQILDVPWKKGPLTFWLHPGRLTWNL